MRESQLSGGAFSLEIKAHTGQVQAAPASVSSSNVMAVGGSEPTPRGAMASTARRIQPEKEVKENAEGFHEGGRIREKSEEAAHSAFLY